MKKIAVRYFGDIQWFSGRKSVSQSYGTVAKAIKAHLRYITNRRRQDVLDIVGLDTESWLECCETETAKRWDARVAAKVVFALPNFMTVEQAKALIEDFISNELNPEQFGYAIHRNKGIVSGKDNLHAHVLFSARKKDGKKFRLHRADLKRLQKTWDVYVYKHTGFKSVEYPSKIDVKIRPHHLDPKNNQYDPEKLNYLLKRREAWKDISESVQEWRKYEHTFLNHIKENLTIPQVLDTYGIPYRIDNHNQLWFKIRDEKNPSCKAQEGNRWWVWYDHGSGENGTVIDLIWQLEGHSGNINFKELRQILREKFPFLFSQPVSSRGENEQIDTPSNQTENEPTKTLPVTVKRSLSPKRMSKKIQTLLWKERRLKVADLERFSVNLVQIGERWRLGVRNIQGGWEVFDIQSSGWKQAIGPKNISVLKSPSEKEKSSEKVIVVAESAFDVIAVSKLIGKISNSCEWVSLNSVVNAEKFINWIKERLDSSEKKKGKGKGDIEVILALDNDEAGKKAREWLKRELERLGITCRIYRSYYDKDPMEAWLSKCKRREQLVDPGL